MKKLLMVVSMFILTLTTNGQIQETKVDNVTNIGSVKSGMYTVLELNYRVVKDDTLYSLMYINAKYQYTRDVKFIHFYEQGGTLESLYTILSNCMKEGKDFEKTFNLGNDQVIVTTSKSMGVKYLFFYVADKGYTTITEKQLKKLFNK